METYSLRGVANTTGALSAWLSPFSNRDHQTLKNLTLEDHPCPSSMRDSYGVFCYPDIMWKNMESIAKRQRIINLDPPDAFIPQDRGVYWQTLWEPELNCAHEMRIGLAGDGGKWLCDPYAILGTKRHEGGDPCLIYSIGSNNEFSFEEDVHSLFSDCEIHTFDHTVDFPDNPPFVNYHAWGLAEFDVGEVRSKGDKIALQSGTLYSFPTIMKALGHEKRRIHALKIDIEGFETVAFRTFFNSDMELPFDMILIEVHYFKKNPGAYVEIDKLMLNFISRGYWITHKEMNIMGEPKCCVELALVKMAPTFGK